MTQHAASTEVLRTLRQRGSAAMGWVAAVLFGAMALLALTSREVSLPMVGFMLLAATGGYVLFARPSVALTLDGVDLRNPFRTTHIPWSQVEDVAARWNLEVYAGGRSYPAWAIASHIDRPATGGGGGLFGLGRLGAQAQKDAASAPKPPSGATVASASKLIEETRGEWAELVAVGHPNGHTGGALTRTWDWVDISFVAVPVVLLLVGLVV